MQYGMDGRGGQFVDQYSVIVMGKWLYLGRNAVYEKKWLVVEIDLVQIRY
jgi:hypothetical protein